MKGKSWTILYIIFFGLASGISFYQNDSFGGIILGMTFIYYIVKYIRKYK